MDVIKVVIADATPILRWSLCRLFEAEPGIAVVGEASDGWQALHLVETRSPHVLLIDVKLPKLSGVEVVRRLQDTASPVKILVFSAYPTAPAMLQALLACGIAGYLTQDEAPAHLLEAVRGAARGEHGWFSRTIALRMSRGYLTQEGPEHKTLTPREMEILQGLVEGKSNQAIGQRLGVSAQTVAKHLGSIYRKLGVGGRTEAAAVAVRQGLA